MDVPTAGRAFGVGRDESYPLARDGRFPVPVLRLGRWLVFTREDGAPLDPADVYGEFVRLVREAGLAHLKLHGLRHLNISLQLDAGVSETVIAMRVGHTAPALIRSTYGHLIGTVGQRAAEATAALVPRKRKKNKRKAS